MANKPRRKVSVGSATVSVDDIDGTIYDVRIGSVFITVWMDEEGYAKIVAVHNANDKKVIVPSYPEQVGKKSAIWLERR